MRSRQLPARSAASLAAAIALLVVALALFGPARSEAAAPVTPPADLGADAIWVWSWDSPTELRDYVLASDLRRVYLYCEGGFSPRVRETIAVLSGAGVRVEALAGEPIWAVGRRDWMLEFIAKARRYQRETARSTRLAGIHLDVEPHALAVWDHHERRTARAFVRSLRVAERAAGPLPVTADLAFWFDGVKLGGGRGALSVAALRAVDKVAVMAYRDEADDVISVSRDEVRQAARLRKRVIVGVDTGDSSPEYVTFAEEGQALLVAATAAIRAGYANSPGFGGIAVHSYGSLLELGP